MEKEVFMGKNRGCASKDAKNKYINELITCFESYLLNFRGLSHTTIRGYCDHIRFFLTVVLKKRRRIEAVISSDIIKFILSLAQVGKSNLAKHITSSLRSFFRFLNQRGLLNKNLEDCVPSVALYKRTAYPTTLKVEEVQQLLNSCGKESEIELRNYAILLLLTRLGLRACEVLRLTLDDIDWEKGEIIIHDKGNSQSCFPLFKEVGEALANYLQHGRPNCLSKDFFIRVRLPKRGLKSHCSIANMVRKKLDEAHLTPAKRGSHLLRHTFATELLRQGVSLQDIAVILRHKSISTTAIYAKIDFDRLRVLALPWPKHAARGGDHEKA
jgi:integrase/recombinase XerD